MSVSVELKEQLGKVVAQLLLYIIHTKSRLPIVLSEGSPYRDDVPTVFHAVRDAYRFDFRYRSQSALEELAEVVILAGNLLANEDGGFHGLQEESPV